MRITSGGRCEEFAAGCSWKEVAERFQDGFSRRILLAEAGGKLYELHKACPDEDVEARFLSTADKIGCMCYQRSALFLMLKAFQDVFAPGNPPQVVIDHSLGGSLYAYLEGGGEVHAALLQKVKERMRQYVEEAVPIRKHCFSKDEALRMFRAEGMQEKEHLFRYRINGYVNVYSLQGFKDYFYGYMVHDASYLPLFDLFAYGEGFILLLPTLRSPDALPAFRPMDSLYRIRKHSSDWCRKIGVPSIAFLNDKIVSGEADRLILMQEALFEKDIGNIAARIWREQKRIVMIAGPSSSGKTSFSKRLSIQLAALGLSPHTISADNYFRSRHAVPRDENGDYDFESIECVDLPLFRSDMQKLLGGERVRMPHYNFLTGESEYRGDTLTLRKGDILLIEGIHCLNGRMSQGLPEAAIFRIYVSALTPLNIDSHNLIPSSDVRLLRRIVRDNRARGCGAEGTLLQWPKVQQGEEENIFPYQESADVMVNSSMIYELPVLKIYAQPLLFQVGEASLVYLEAKRMLKFLEYVLPISPEGIPQNSILREFIGGSCLDVG